MMPGAVDVHAHDCRRFFPRRAAFLCAMLAALWAPNAGAAALDEAAEQYRRYLIEDIGRALAGVRTLRERLDANDLPGAKRAWIEARIGWERSEVFTSGFVPELDRQIDAWPDSLQGFHGIEANLFGANRTDVREETDALIADLQSLHAQLREIPLTPQGLLNGIARLAFEIGGNKADGGESRLSGTSLNDMQSNADGIELAYRIVFSDAVKARDPKQAEAAQAAIQRLKAGVGISDLRNLDSEKLSADSEGLVALLQSAALKIGLDKPTLEEGGQ
jgi:iron uptake system component EfeO